MLIVLSILISGCFTLCDEHFDEINSQREHYAEGEFTATDLNLDGSVVFSAFVVTKRDGHFLIHVKASENFGPRDSLICFNPIKQYQFELEKNEQDYGWKLASVQTEITDPIGIVGPNGLYRHFWSPLSIGTAD